MANRNPPKTRKALQGPRKRLPEGFSSAYSQIVFPALIFGAGKSSQYAHIGPGPKFKINAILRRPLAVRPVPGGGRKMASRRIPKPALATSNRARAKRGLKARPPSALLPGLPPAGLAPCHAASGRSCPVRRLRRQSAPNCTYPGTWQKSVFCTHL